MVRVYIMDYGFNLHNILYLIWCFTLLFRHCWSYYDTLTCYGTGDCIFSLSTGGHADDQHRWNTECHDGEGIIAILDGGSDYQGFGQVWCRFLFPKKAPSFGIYPYYPFCNIRDISLREYYCYDKLYPSDTYDTFFTGMSSSQYYPGGISVSSSYKCCRLPDGYHIYYQKCEYKYTHDRWGEHYDGTFWFVKCERNYVMTGLGQGANPWTNAMHYTWIQCCPFFYDPLFQTPLQPPNRTTFNYNQRRLQSNGAPLVLDNSTSTVSPPAATIAAPAADNGTAAA